jgi:hypothetical protein
MYSIPALRKFCVEHRDSGVILTGHISRNRGGLGDRPTTMTLYRGRYLPFCRYKKHPGLDVNVKNARVRARAEVSCGHYKAIPMVCGGRNCIHYPLVLSSVVGSTNNKGVEDDISR